MQRCKATSESTPLSKRNVEALLAFLPVFEAPSFVAGKWSEVQEIQGETELPYFVQSQAVSDFMDACYRNGFVTDFDWGSPAWQEQVQRYMDRPERLGDADLVVLRRLITTHIRNDRFCDGHLAKMFEGGHIVAILRRLKDTTQRSKDTHPMATTTHNPTMLDWTTLRHHIDRKDLGYVCPVEGCGTRLTKRQSNHFVFDQQQYGCSQDGIVFSPSTFEYEDAKRNMLWGDFASLMAMTSKREKKRLGRDNSEDAVTWNVFRYLVGRDERQDLLCLYLSRLAKVPLQPRKTVFWSHDTETGGVWSWLMKARKEFELSPRNGSEPDLIVLTDKVLFFIEAKVNAPNSTTPSSPESEDKYVTGGGGWWKSAFKSGTDYAQIAVHDRKYELMRFWLLGTWMAKELGVGFRLVNLLRRDNRDREEEKAKKGGKPPFGTYLSDNPNALFLRETWEGIHEFIKDAAPQSADKDTMISYFRNKTIGYRDGELIKAFGV